MARFNYAMRNLAGAIGVLVAAFFVATSGLNTMLTIGITAIIAGIFSFGIREDTSGKRYGPYMLFYGGVLVVASLICLAFEKSYGILKYVGGVAVALTGYFQWIKIGNLFGPTKVLRKIEGLAIISFPILITVGVVLSVFTQKLALGETLIIVGAAIWLVHNIYALILMDRYAEPDLNKFRFNPKHSTYNFDKHKTLDQDDVIEIVHSIARRYDRKDSLPNSAAVTFYVYEDVSGSDIKYTISGTLHGTLTLLDKQRMEVQAALQRKLQQMQQGLMTTTQKELTKYKQLPYSSYNISVEIGYFDE